MSVKEEYQQQMEAKLKAWDAKLDELKAKAESAQAETNIQLKKEIASLQQKQETAQGKLKQLKEAGEDAWRILRQASRPHGMISLMR